jgi:hypothetical protein
MIESPDQNPMLPVRRGLDSALRAWLQLPRELRAVAPLCVMAMLWWSSDRAPLLGGPGVGLLLAHNSMHGIAYAALAGLLLLAFTEDAARGTTAAAVWSLAIATAYGALDEVHQAYVAGRVCSVGDFLADATGAASAVAFLRARLHVDRFSAAAFPFCVLGFVASVALATWTPL